MNKKNVLLIACLLIATLAGIVWAADHTEAPAITSTTSDITDFYAFQSPDNANNLVFVCNLQGLLAPSATAAAAFDENVMVEFNIDNTGDNVEDLVIQALFSDGELIVYGPAAPVTTGLISQVQTRANTQVRTNITAYGENPSIGAEDGVMVFAGPRDDPFFMDFAQFGEIMAGNATSFNDPGNDTFAGTNVMSVVVEVPKSMLGNAATLNTWVATKRKI